MLLRLHSDFFDFNQAKSHGEDFRVSASTGEPLAYHIDMWDALQGTANIWVRIPNIEENSRQQLHLHWGKADAISESDSRAVFNESNGYLSVWHMNDPVTDDVQTLASIDTGTTPTHGIIGARVTLQIKKESSAVT